jgi:hypothetical protein
MGCARAPHYLFRNRKLLQNQTGHLLALLLSVTAHVGLAFAFGNGKGTAAGHSAPGQSATMTVAMLIPPASDKRPEILQSATPAQSDVPPAPPPPALAGRGTAPSSQASDTVIASRTVGHDTRDEAPVLPALTGTEPYYFLPGELTESPVVVRDISPRMVEALPDMSRRPVQVHLLINEEGDVDQALIDEETLSKQAKRFISEAFTTVKFRPGRIGELPVKSELSIEVTLDQVLVVPVVPPVIR